MKRELLPLKAIGKLFILPFLLFSLVLQGQTNVFDDVIATSPNHTSLKAALEQEGLDAALQDVNATLTVFAPDNAAFDALAEALGTDLAGLLALPDLDQILLYHVLGVTVASDAVMNGDIVTPLNAANTLKLTKTSMGDVFVNQAQVNAADLTTDNGVVHSLNAVVLPAETVVDVAIDNGFSTLATAVITAELIPALSDPFASYTVFAPTNAAFDAAVASLGIDIPTLLTLPNLGDILTYHVLGTEVTSDMINNGDIVAPLSMTNTLKLTVTSMGEVFVNQAQVTGADVGADNGVVHILDAVVLPSETVVDVAIDNGFSTLATAVITAELIPALSDPFASYTVFAPTNAAFDAAVASLGIDIPTLLTLPNLGDILTYHVLGTEVTSDMINNGDIVAPLSMTNTLKLTKTSMGEVFVNQAQVTGADVGADNGVVHILDAVVLPSETVVDVAIDNGFSTLATAVITAELIPALSDPFASYTVFAPTNAAFDAAVASLGIDIPTLLTLPNLGDILTYHVLGTEVTSDMINNGDIVAPLSMTNTLKLTVTSMGEVFVNQAQVTGADVGADNGVVHILDAVVLPSETVVDVAIDNGFSTLATAVITAELIPALSDPFASYTVFAPTNAAFDAAVASLGIDIPTLLTLPNLGDILTYHVLGAEVTSDMVNNGDIVAPLSMTNTLKLTVTSMGEVFVNQAQVTGADVGADNGVVHILDAVVLPSETVVDVAIDNGFSTLATAVITAELIPALSDPFATYTVFAPTNAAFDSAVAKLGIDIPTLLTLPNLGDILTYHVLGIEVTSDMIFNGDIANPLSTTNTLKLTKTSEGNVFVNQAMVTTADVGADNGVVHILDGVVLPIETVVDVAIDNSFTTLATAVITAELIPALSDPFSQFTVFAPTNDAFDALVGELGIDIPTLLTLPNLGDILTYHVVSGTVLSTDLMNGDVVTLNGESITVDLTNGVMINDATVTTADVLANNGVVHIINKVLVPSTTASRDAENILPLNYFPNPTTDAVYLTGIMEGDYQVFNINGKMVNGGILTNNMIRVDDLPSGTYIIRVLNDDNIHQARLIKL